MSSQMQQQELPYGTFGPYGDNEVLLKSTKDDPPKFRMESPGPGRSLGALSFGRSGNEKVLIQGKLSEDGQRGEFGIWLYDESRPGTEDDKMGEPVFYVTPSGVTGGTSTQSSSRFYSGNGKWCWNYQDDGAVVLYDTHNSTNETTWTPKWALRADGNIEK